MEKLLHHIHQISVFLQGETRSIYQFSIYELLVRRPRVVQIFMIISLVTTCT